MSDARLAWKGPKDCRRNGRFQKLLNLGSGMAVLGKRTVAVTRHIQKLRGGSQPILAEASDGRLYVVKFANNLQGANLLFNESMGSELYRACKLPGPAWKPLQVSDFFIEQNPNCWMETEKGSLRPEAGWCFGSQYLGEGGGRLLEILPGSSFSRVQNHNSFWLAWLIDICAGHVDNRQAVFQEDVKGQLQAYFVDHGHLFGGPKGEQRMHFQASRYLDPRIYQSVSSQHLLNFRRIARCMNVDRLWQSVQELPEQWKTASALEGFTQCLDRLASPGLLQNILDTMVDAQRQAYGWEQSKRKDGRESPTVLRPGVQAAGLGANCAAACAGHLACA